MKIPRKLFATVLALLAAQYCQAQSSAMMDPVSFKLKNGMIIILAENKGVANVFAGFGIDADAKIQAGKPGTREILDIIFSETAAATKTGITFNEKGGNISVEPEGFSDALTSLANVVQYPLLTAELFEKSKEKLILSVRSKDRYYPESYTEDGLNDLILDDVQAFYLANVAPSRAYLTIVGNFKLSAIKSTVKKAFGRWGEVYITQANR